MHERHLLVVDDDDRIRALLKEYLSRAGFRVTTAADAAAARRLLATLDFDLLVFDVMMPGEDGFSLTQWVRNQGPSRATPVLVLTARDSAGDRIEGLRLGADDYLAKPFEPRELLLRIASVLRRSSRDGPPPPPHSQFGRFVFDLVRNELVEGGSIVHLTSAETTLLAALAAKPGQILSREQMAAIIGLDGNLRTVDVQVTRLRKKIEDDPRFPRYLQTVRGQGYVLWCD
jgi:two-component system phosphate regulon response regulator OmpR